MTCYTTAMTIPVADLPEMLTLPDASKMCFGGAVSAASIRRWSVKGIGKPSIRLRMIRAGGRLLVRPADIQEFLLASADPAAHLRREATERTAKAVRKLVAAGA